MTRSYTIPPVRTVQKKKSRLRRVFISVLTGLAILAIAVIITFKVSPWPSALLIRKSFAREADKTNKALENHVPPGISSILNQQYDSNDNDAFLDIYFPSAIEHTGKTVPAIVWVHGGGWISGKKEDVSNYCKILAGKGYTTISIDYTVAPEKKYPTPVRQVNNALGYLSKNANHLHIDASYFVLAGDSGGSNIVAQVANIISVPSYARLMDITPSIPRSQLAGLLLYCGPYDVREEDLNGKYGKAMKVFLWAYSGGKDFLTNTKFETIKVGRYVTADFPPAYISAGNNDALLHYSQGLARKLVSLGVYVDSLFFPPEYTPAQPHEYQFNLDTKAGKLALERSIEFLSGLQLKTGEVVD